MGPKFEAEIQQLDQFSYVKLTGTIDEDNDLLPLASRIRGNTVIIDLAGVHDINNCGVRNWVKWREEIQARAIAVVLIECSPAIVAKLNSVSNFNAGGYLKSFYVPFFCHACEMEKAILVDMDELRGESPVRAPTCRCDACDGIMAFDDMEESYFSFVKDSRKAIPLEGVKKVLDQLSPTSGERKIRSRTASRSSSFAGIPSTSSLSNFSQGMSSVSGPSVASLRRLRDKTGLRTLRKTSPNFDPSPLSLEKKWLLWVGSVILIIITIAFVLYIVVG